MMLRMKFLVSLFLILISATYVSGQNLFSLTGQIMDTNGQVVDAATIFIDGSSSQTTSDKNGKFNINNIPAGTYDVTIRMIGYESPKRTILIRESTILNFILKEKSTVLNEVVIGNNSKRAGNLQTFKNYFIGRTDNALSCEIENPEILSFSTNKNVLTAEANNALIITNRNLGYRIKYFLRNFIYNGDLGLTKYDGDCLFEELSGTEKEKLKWKLNRQKAYEGSFMHFLRTLHSKDCDNEGFTTHEYKDMKYGILNKDPIDMYKFVERLDSNFIKLAFKQTLYVWYQTKGAKKIKSVPVGEELYITYYLNKGVYSAHVNMYLDHTIIDRAGHYQDPRSFLLNDRWGRLQIGDRLPYSYQP